MSQQHHQTKLPACQEIKLSMFAYYPPTNYSVNRPCRYRVMVLAHSTLSTFHY